MSNRPKATAGKKGGTFIRLMKSLFHYYPRMLTISVVCIIFNAAVSSLPAIFMQNVFDAVEGALAEQLGWADVGGEVVRFMSILIGCYVTSLIAGAVYNQLMAIITQGYLKKLRGQMFNGMQDLPIRYFDTHNHGDIMSYYTNDIDSLRQMVAQSFPQLLTSSVMVLTLFGIMLYYSVWLSLIVLVGVFFIFLVTKWVGGGASKYFIGQQRAMGKTEGFIEEMMNGQKVIKVFVHEKESKADFDKVNDYLFEQSDKANRFANMLMPIIANIGNVMYVLVAIVGAAGLAATPFSPNPLVSLFFICCSAIGVYAGMGVWWTMPTTFLSGAAAAGAMGLINSSGNVGGWVGPYMLGFLNQTTGSFTIGYLVMGGCMFLAGLLILTLKKENATDDTTTHNASTM